MKVMNECCACQFSSSGMADNFTEICSHSYGLLERNFYLQYLHLYGLEDCCVLQYHKLLYASNMPIDAEHLHFGIRKLTQQLLS